MTAASETRSHIKQMGAEGTSGGGGVPRSTRCNRKMKMNDAVRTLNKWRPSNTAVTYEAMTAV